MAKSDFICIGTKKDIELRIEDLKEVCLTRKMIKKDYGSLNEFKKEHGARYVKVISASKFRKLLEKES